MKESTVKHDISLHAYCLMPNHFHLLVSPQKGEGLSRWMQLFMTSHVRRYHRHYRSSGHVWQGRFKNFLVQDDNHLLAVVRYIEANPVRAGLVVSSADWPWSSHTERLSTGHATLSALPLELPGEWTEYVDIPIKESDLEKIRTSVKRQTPLGWPWWQAKMCEALGLQSTMNPRGRPGKRGQLK